jgi:hypothetical protein
MDMVRRKEGRRKDMGYSSMVKYLPSPGLISSTTKKKKKERKKRKNIDG